MKDLTLLFDELTFSKQKRATVASPKKMAEQMLWTFKVKRKANNIFPSRQLNSFEQCTAVY